MGRAWCLLVVVVVLVTPPGVREGEATEIILQSDDARDTGWDAEDHGPPSRSVHSPPQQPPPTAATPSQHTHRNTTANRTPALPQGDKGFMGQKVDDVLAALVGLSKNPTFWRFVHSVVAELDITQRTQLAQPPSTTHHTKGYWLRIAPGHLPKTRNSKENTWDASNKNRMDEFLTTTSLPPHLPWPHLHSEDQYTPENHAITSQNLLKAPTTQAPHFLFHRVIVDTGYDSHTRQPYRRPVLALTAVDVEKARATGTQNASADAQNTTSYNTQGSGDARNTMYIFNAVTKSQKVSTIPRKKVETVEMKQEVQPIEYNKEIQLRSKLKQQHGHKGSHKPHRFYTFESQLRYLQRWEARLWRRTHPSTHHKTHQRTHSRTHPKL